MRSKILNADAIKCQNFCYWNIKNAVSAVDRINGFLDTIEGNDTYQVVDRKDCLGQTENSDAASGIGHRFRGRI